ncbi:MAG: nucleotidyltransferase domain-containing protein [Planctomycetes bacterium]|nr:nucleotidyltransferase domain-containing protein [Planctomycetota bacterium]
MRVICEAASFVSPPVSEADRLLEEEIVRRILTVCRPKKIILFGSRGRGDARPDSDWDILVIAESDLPRYRRSPPLYGAVSGLRQRMDVLVYTPGEVDEWRDVPLAFVSTAVREGRVIHEDS